MKRAFPFLVAWVLMLTATAATDNMKAFPPAEKGMARYVVALPKEKNEANLRIELIIGKTVALEPQNRYFFGGTVETRIAEGWGFSYYMVPKLGPMAGTLMAVDPNAPKVDRFITLGGEPLLLRYNSKLPVVVYVPEDAEVRYRVWRAPEQATKAKQG